MKIAVLPFNAAENARPALGRQFAAFVVDRLQAETSADLNPVSYLARVDDEAGGQRTAYVNVANGLVEYDFIRPLFQDPQAEVDKVMDGLLEQNEDRIKLTMRFHSKDSEEPIYQNTFDFGETELFGVLQQVTAELAKQAGVELTEGLKEGQMEFGTDDPVVFLRFLEGFDAFKYIQQANGMVAREFSPQPSFDALLEAVRGDRDFLGAYDVLVQLCRVCTMYQIGSFEEVEKTLLQLVEMEPDDYKAHFALGELYQAVGHPQTSETWEKAVTAHAKEEEVWKEDGRHADWVEEHAILLSKLGYAQMAQGMPVNAERNLRRALELESQEKPSLDLLAAVLQQTGRAHEVPSLYKDLAAKDPQNGLMRAKYAVALVNAEHEQEGVQEFEKALSELEDSTVIKRFYAPYLSAKEEVDRAMDFYEDCLEVAPDDIQLLVEYVQTLKKANRDFEAPPYLQRILQHNQDPNLRAETLALLTEIEQPKRAEAVQQAEEKMSNGDFEGALRDLKPMRNWLADYWKMWALLSAAHNRLSQAEEAADAANHLLNLFPGCEPGYIELSAALTQLERKEEAYNVMRAGVNNIPQSLGLRVNLALAANRAGHTDEARSLAKHIREAVGPNPQLDEVLAEIER